MNPSGTRSSDPFYVPKTSVQKTSAEIINEARNSLRTLRTQRPFTPRNDQRRLFDPSSSRTPASRPPSSFSLHASSFESPDSRPVSGTRLCPLPHKPKFPLSPKPDDDAAHSKPVQAKKIGVCHPRFCKAGSHGNLSEHEIPSKAEMNQQISEDLQLDLKVNLERDFASSFKFNPEPHHIPTGRTKIPAQESPCISSNTHNRESKGRPSSCPSRAASDYMGSKSVSELEATANEIETEQEAMFWNKKIFPILQDLESAQQEKNVEDICQLCVKLHTELASGNMLGKRSKERVVLLKTLFKLVEMDCDKLGLILAKLILALKVSGKNLLNTCKLIFKISRSENNDCLFQSDNIVDSLLEILQNEDVHANSEAFLYCMGAVKFLSGNTLIVNELLKKQCVEILLQLIKKVTCSRNPSEIISSCISHLLVQVTATLRNLADLSMSRSKFLESNALSELCAMLEQHVWDKDICTNVSRIFSKLSSYNDFCLALANCSRSFTLLLSVLNKHSEKQDLVVRIAFTLGNLTAKSNQTREQFYNEQGSIKTLLRLLQTYCELDIKSTKSKVTEIKKTVDLKKNTETEDVLIKVIRVLANLCIHPAVGTDLATNQDCIALLMQILEYKSIDECEELVINAVATINNLSYYQHDTSAITCKRLEISKLLLKLLLCNNMDGILETVRVFGNLSRYDDVRDFMMKNNVYKFIVALLDAKQQEVCFSASGVLVNLTVDHSNRAVLKEEAGVEKMIDCLRDFSPFDWQLAGLVCKALWNFSEDFESSYEAEESRTLQHLLESFLDEQIALGCVINGDLMEYHRSCWKMEFQPVALQLLERLKRHHSDLEPLPFPV
ncbi:hypothetical protein GDO86_009741 [Hymenochirus boettgeri]|uniref:Armadillo repeat-containing protein 2 n=1 Tax=Hymenochirus boettgeri TaxID=247094 RepID=A0A8T2JHE4_9PIPI|nr:hypothetical protein GDO86_009741 [Hymenochirus boettgeri]